MADHFVEAFVEKLILLEQTTGAEVKYCAMRPFPPQRHDYLSIQEVARDIAHFVGLNHLTFIVGVAKQKKNVGGHIDLTTEDNSLFIEIDDDVLKFPDVVAAVLCHEVCHKWLEVHRLTLPLKMENEILTDITTVFLGLGKIMLNGCRASNTRHQTLTQGTRTITESMTAGYLKRDQLAFVYRVVCAARNMTESDVMDGLNVEARQALYDCDASLASHYDGRFHCHQTTCESVDAFQSHITEL